MDGNIVARVVPVEQVGTIVDKVEIAILQNAKLSLALGIRLPTVIIVNLFLCGGGAAAFAGSKFGLLAFLEQLS